MKKAAAEITAIQVIGLARYSLSSSYIVIEMRYRRAQTLVEAIKLKNVLRNCCNIDSV